ncbi:MAG: peptidoglycan DD-metalloendopeptidase family protein [Prochloraceae cyanobacterium]|nr:peptidoglycan DD-metalloendopeptidase family protein [Prochloraceae cyanobacterium]
MLFTVFRVFCAYFKTSFVFPVALVGLLAIPLTVTARVKTPARSSLCPEPILERLKSHKITDKETIESIAKEHNLFPDTLIRLNPTLTKSKNLVGQEIFIPPYNGIRFQVPAGATWKDLEQAYGVRADVLFEINGCQRIPKIVFLPGVNWEAIADKRQPDYLGLTSYPLPQLARVGMNFGWQEQNTRQKRMFHPGLDLLANRGTAVLAADRGIVAFVGQENNYGNLIVINHPGGWQTRYGHLSEINVKIGQEVKSAQTIGSVGYSGIPDLKATHLHFEVRRKTPLGWLARDPQFHLQ